MTCLFYTHRFGNRQAVRGKNIAGLSVTVPSLSVSVTGLSVIVYGLSVSVSGLSVTNFPDSRTQSVTITNWPVNFTGLSGTVTDRPAKVSDCTVTFPAQSVYHHIQLGSPYWDKPDTCYRQACLINRHSGKCNRQAVKLTGRPVARWMKLGSDTKVGNGRRNIKHV